MAFNFTKEKFQRSCFPVKFAKLLRKTIFKNICEPLLLYLYVILFTMNEKDCWETWPGRGYEWRRITTIIKNLK